MRWLIAVLLLADVLPCGGSRRPLHTPAAFAGPDWVRAGSRPFAGERGRFFQGVGSIANVRNARLRNNVAAERGRGEVSRLVADYAASWGKLAAGDLGARQRCRKRRRR